MRGASELTFVNAPDRTGKQGNRLPAADTLKYTANSTTTEEDD